MRCEICGTIMIMTLPTADKCDKECEDECTMCPQSDSYHCPICGHEQSDQFEPDMRQCDKCLNYYNESIDISPAFDKWSKPECPWCMDDQKYINILSYLFPWQQLESTKNRRIKYFVQRIQYMKDHGVKFPDEYKPKFERHIFDDEEYQDDD